MPNPAQTTAPNAQAALKIQAKMDAGAKKAAEKQAAKAEQALRVATMEAWAKKQASASVELGNVAPGDEIMFLSDYDFEIAVVHAIGRTTFKIVPGRKGSAPWGDSPPEPKRLAKEKCAALGERVCVANENWKGGNHGGGHRIERALYASDRLPAREVGRQRGQGRVSEDAFPAHVAAAMAAAKERAELGEALPLGEPKRAPKRV